jgi:hypothetical protein
MLNAYNNNISCILRSINVGLLTVNLIDEMMRGGVKRRRKAVAFFDTTARIRLEFHDDVQ